jgi:hypothetical protein
LEFSGKIGVKLADGFAKWFRILLPLRIWLRRVPAIHELDEAQSGVIGDQQAVFAARVVIIR